jgi:hypothetical protein
MPTDLRAATSSSSISSIVVMEYDIVISPVAGPRSRYAANESGRPTVHAWRTRSRAQPTAVPH